MDLLPRALRRMRWRALVEQLRTSLWFVPTLFVGAAVLLAVLLIWIDVEKAVPERLVFPGGADSARGILQAIAGSVITVTGVVFSLTVVTLQLASTQFSPRLLRTFLRGVSNQVVLGTFLATFAYALVVLRAVQSGETPEDEVVPAVAVTGAYVLAAASVAALVYFIDHIARSIRIDNLMREVNHDTRSVLEHVHPEPAGSVAMPEAHELSPPDGATPVSVDRSGFVQGVDRHRLLEIAVRHDVVLRLEPLLGHRVVEGGPLAWVWPGERGCEVPDDLAATIREQVQIGFERTMAQDLAFGFRQLVDVAVKALSPGVNDPTTAVHAIGHLASLLVVLTQRHVAPQLVRDDEGTVRVVVPHLDLPGYLDLACGQIRRYGASEPTVMAELLGMLGDVARCDLPPDHAAAIGHEADLVLAAAERETVEPADLEPIRAVHGEVRRRLAPGDGFSAAAAAG